MIALTLPPRAPLTTPKTTPASKAMPPTQRTHSTTSAPFSLLRSSSFKGTISLHVFIESPPRCANRSRRFWLNYRPYCDREDIYHYSDRGDERYISSDTLSERFGDAFCTRGHRCDRCSERAHSKRLCSICSIDR